MKNKLSEKTRGAQSEEQVLLKAFKYFDLNDNGVVEPDEFAKAIEKIGIQIPTRQVSPLFNVHSRKHTQFSCLNMAFLASFVKYMTSADQRYDAKRAFALFF